MAEKYLRNIKAQQLGTFLGNHGIPTYGKLLYCAQANGGFEKYLGDIGVDTYKTLALTYAGATTNQNDVVLISPGSWELSSAITWAKSNTHLVGMCGNYRYANGVLIANASATAVSPMFSVTGSDNVFTNLHLRHAVGSNASNLTALRVTGDGNLFENCWFEGPCDDSVADLATARLIQIAGANNTFRNCHFGGTWSPMSAAGATLEYYDTTYEATFENCTFNMWIDATSPCFIYVKTGKAQMMQYYRNCQFYVMSTNQAYDMAAMMIFQSDDATGHHLFDADCQAYNVTYIVGAQVNPRLSVYWGTNHASTAPTTIGRAITTT